MSVSGRSTSSRRPRLTAAAAFEQDASALDGEEFSMISSPPSIHTPAPSVGPRGVGGSVVPPPPPRSAFGGSAPPTVARPAFHASSGGSMSSTRRHSSSPVPSRSLAYGGETSGVGGVDVGRSGEFKFPSALPADELFSLVTLDDVNQGSRYCYKMVGAHRICTGEYPCTLHDVSSTRLPYVFEESRQHHLACKPYKDIDTVFAAPFLRDSHVGPKYRTEVESGLKTLEGWRSYFLEVEQDYEERQVARRQLLATPRPYTSEDDEESDDESGGEVLHQVFLESWIL